MMFSIWQGCGRIMLWKQASIHWSHCGRVLWQSPAAGRGTLTPLHPLTDTQMQSSVYWQKCFQAILLLTPLSNFCLTNDYMSLSQSWKGGQTSYGPQAT